MTAAIPSLQTIQHKGRQVKRIEFVHMVNLLWQPVLKYLEDLFAGKKVEWTKTLQVHHTTLAREMEGIVLGPQESLTIDEWVEFLQQTLFRLVGVQVPSRLINTIVSLLVPFHLEPTRANAMHLLRSSVCSKLIGTSMSTQVNRMILAEITELPVPLLSDVQMSIGMKEELVGHLERSQCSDRVSEESEHERPSKR